MEIIHILEQSHNLFYSFCLLVSVVVWGISALGLIGGESIGHEIGAHDGLPDISLSENHIPVPIFEGMAKTLGIGLVPSSILITLYSFFLSLVGIGCNQLIIPLFSLEGMSASIAWWGFFLASNVASFGLTSFFSRPLRFLFKDYGKAISSVSLVGKTAKISSGKINQHSGQAIIQLSDGNAIEIAVRIADEVNQIKYGQDVLIVDFDKEKNIYWVEYLDYS